MPSRFHRRTLRKRFYHFWRAAWRRDVKTVVRMIRKYPELHDYEGEAGGLVELLDYEAPELLEIAFQAGLHPDAGQEGVPQTFLQSAAAKGDVDKVRLALRHGADPEFRNDQGETALGYACTWGQYEVVRALVEAGADVNAIEQDPKTGSRNTPLDCTRRHPAIAEFLRAQGACYLHELEQ